MSFCISVAGSGFGAILAAPEPGDPEFIGPLPGPDPPLPYNPEADLNGDGVVTPEELAQWQYEEAMEAYEEIKGEEDEAYIDIIIYILRDLDRQRRNWDREHPLWQGFQSGPSRVRGLRLDG